MKLDGSPPGEAGLLADHLPAPPSDTFSPPPKRHPNHLDATGQRSTPHTAAFSPSSPSQRQQHHRSASSSSSEKARLASKTNISTGMAASEMGHHIDSSDGHRYPRSVSNQREMKSLSPTNDHSAPRGSLAFRLPPIATWKGADEERLGQRGSSSSSTAYRHQSEVLHRAPPSLASSPPALPSTTVRAASTGHSPGFTPAATVSGGRLSPPDSNVRSFRGNAMAHDNGHRYPSPSYGYHRANEARESAEWETSQDRSIKLHVRPSSYEHSSQQRRRSPLPQPLDLGQRGRPHQDRQVIHSRPSAEALPSLSKQAFRTTSPESRLHRLPSLHRIASPSPRSAPPVADSSRQNADGFPGREMPSMIYHSSSEPRLPPPSLHTQAPGQSTQSNRASTFMASLLRAAQSPELSGHSDGTFAHMQSTAAIDSPMSVHSIVEGRALSPQTDRRTRKRRTSSVQEPLQGSALEAATRAQSFPRRNDHGGGYHRAHAASDFGSAERSPPGMDFGQAAAPSRSHLHGSDLRSPMPDSAHYSRFDSADDGAATGNQSRHHKWQTDEMRRASPFLTEQQQPAGHHVNNRHEASYPTSDLAAQSAHRSHGHPGTYDGYRRAPEYSSGPPPPSDFAYGGRGGGGGEIHPAYHPDRMQMGQPGVHHGPMQGRQTYGLNGPLAMQQPASFPPSTTHMGPTVMHAGGGGGVPVESTHWNAELASRAWNEQIGWARLSMEDRSQQVLQSIWDARVQIGSTTSYWPPKLSNVTTIRCMYANIAQKSYGTEKRFLCPPPVVKISGPLRPCKWVTMRVTLGDSALGPSNSTRGVGSSGALGSTAGGEEQAILDANAEARFGKLHVGSVSDASSKVFRLQINLLRAESITDDAKGGVQRAIQEMGGPLNLPTHAWATFHSSPINVISKPARKSVRTRAASPAIASGSVVCLYNRLNSQTVRTKYLGVEAGSISDVGEHVQVARKLIARQEGWEGFSIELLARPLHDPAVARVKLRGASSEEWGITYGSIVCLRDVNSKLCSDPMLICKVDKGRVELSSVTGDTTGTNNGKVRFQIVSKNRQEALEILFGGSRKWTGDATAAWPSPKAGDSSETQKLDRGHREGSQASSSNNGGSPALADADKASSVPTANATTTAAAADASGSMGGPVIQMQKVTLMHVVPKPSTHSADEIECDLSTPRAYLCSTASDGQRDSPIQPVLARSKRRMQVRSEAVLGNEIDGEPVLDEADAPVDASPRPHGKGASGGDMPMATQGTTSATSSVQSSMVGFTCPPTATANDAGSSGQVDFLEDQFCWTIVTISCTEVSFIDANSPADGSSAYPHLPCSPLPVTPFPCLAAQPTYDPRSHAISATIHDFLLADGLDGGRHLFNTVSAVHAVPNKVAHDVWLAHSGPLSAHVSSAGPYMSDVTVQLPGMDKLAGLHAELYGLPSTTSIEQINVIQLPLLFVRLAQGVTFPSGHWLLAERTNAGHRHGGHTASAWTIRVI